MHTIRLGFGTLWLLILGLTSAFGQVKFRVGIDSDKVTYRVYMTSTTSYTGNNARISTSQVTLLVPHGMGSNQFMVNNLTGKQVGSNQMAWSLNARVDAPTENPGVDYLSFGFSGSASPVLFDIPANQEIELFSFKNTGACLGIVSLFENNTDPFRTPNSRNTNPGNQMTILGHGPGNTYVGNYGSGASCSRAVPDLTASISGPSSLTTGNSGNYVVTVSNVGSASSAGVISVNMLIPAGLTFTSATGSGWSCTTGNPSAGSQPVSCTSAAVLAVSATSSFTLNTIASASSAITTTLSGSVSGGGETNLTNNTFSQPVTIQPVSSGAYDLSLAITAPSSLSSGGTGNVVLTVTNVGTGSYIGSTTIKTWLPTGFTYNGTSTSGWTCSSANQPNQVEVTCTTSQSVGAGAGLPPVQLSVTGVNSGTSVIQLPVSGTLIVGGGNDNPSNNYVYWPISILGNPTKPVSATADLSTTVKVTNSAPNQYESVQAIIVVTNTGPNSATGITSKVTIPSGYPVVSYTASGGTFLSATGIWNVGSLAAGQSVTLTVTLSANTEGVANISNEIITSGQYDPDSTPNNHVEGEDDQAQSCFSVPIVLCPGQAVETSVPGSLTAIQWYRNGQPIPQATSATLTITQEGTYTVMTNVSCPSSGCCPLIVRMNPAGSCCQPVQCVPFVVRKKSR
ncbi:DUF11 domain-containing protein [Spirosoma sp. 48-14]|uniref:DUF11 domain-containing protein n=1 Tax=Spirosoma sp. 48-14 TaxID=1895854 RepID=UPI0009637FDF|nr:DUF11 domain-containing protein [Spirosoma sp. 48-14]OJW75644.1 MAG: hypothetical protein BGO59_08715 [Spirosoma sp. 48-14]